MKSSLLHAPSVYLAIISILTFAIIGVCSNRTVAQSHSFGTLYGGTVVLPDGTPAAGCKLSGTYFRDRSWRTVEAIADATGNFEINLGDPASLRLLICESQDKQSMGAIPIESSASNPFKRRSLGTHQLKQPRSSRVSVTNEVNQPIADATVVVQSSHQIIAEGKTDVNGKLTIEFPAGLELEVIGAIKAKFGLDYRAFERPVDRTDPKILPQDYAGDINLTLNGVREMTVKVLDPRGEPLRGMELSPFSLRKDDRGGHWSIAMFEDAIRRTDSNGVAVFDFLPPNFAFEITIGPTRIRKDWYVSGTSIYEDAHFARKGDASQTIRCLEKLKIGGTVRHIDGSPAAGIGIRIEGTLHDTPGCIAIGFSDESGRWNAFVKPDGYYLMVVCDNTWTAEPHDSVVLRSGDQTPEFDFELIPVKRIIGTVTGVTDETTQIRLLQKARDYHEVPIDRRLVRPKELKFDMSPAIHQNASIDSDGSFEFRVGPGIFEVIDPDGNQETFSITKDDGDKYLHVFANQLAMHRVKITVIDPNGQPVANAKVNDLDPVRGYVGVTNKNGMLTTTRNAANAKVFVISEDEKLSALASIGMSESDIAIALKPCIKISGRLLNGAGQPYANKTLQLNSTMDLGNRLGGFRPEFYSQHKNAITDENGMFEFAFVTQGFDRLAIVALEQDEFVKLFPTQAFEGLQAASEDIDIGDVTVPFR